MLLVEREERSTKRRSYIVKYNETQISQWLGRNRLNIYPIREYFKAKASPEVIWSLGVILPVDYKEMIKLPV